MTRENLIIFLEKNGLVTAKHLKDYLREHDSHLVSHELQIEVFANSPGYLNLILLHYKRTLQGGIGLYKSDPILGKWTKDGKVELCSFPLPCKDN